MGDSNRQLEDMNESLPDKLFAKDLSRRRFLKTTALAVGALSATSLLAACGGDDDSGDDSSDDDTSAGSGDSDSDAEASDDDEETEDSEEETEEDPAEGDDEDDSEDSGDEASAPSGGELVIANEQTPVSLDPCFHRDVGSTRAMMYMYDSLVESNVDTELIPGLASDWEIADDSSQYIFHLQEGVTFHDGEEFNAEAAKVNLDRNFDESLNTNFYDDFTEYVGSPDNIVASGDMTLEINFDEVYVRFMHDVLHGYAGSMVSPAALEEQDNNVHSNPVGTGPYQFVEYEPDSVLVMERFDDYWRGTPGLDGIRVRIIPEQSVQMAELEAGNVDLSFSVQAQDVERLEEAGITVNNQPGLTATWISFNCAKGHTQEQAVREAIALTVDREAIVSELLLGYGQVSRGGAAEGWPRYHEDLPIDEYDPDEAGAILDEAGWVMGDGEFRERDGEVLTVNVLSTQLERQLSYGLMNELIQEGMRSIGIQTEIQTMEWGAYLDEFRAGEFWEVSFHAQNAAFVDAVQAQQGDTYWNVNQLFKIEDESHDLYDVAQEMDALYTELDQTVDDEERVEIYRQIQELSWEHKLLSWLVHWDALVGHTSRVQNLQIKPAMQYTLASPWEITISE